RSRMERLADRLRREPGVAIDVLPADLTNPQDLARVEALLREDDRIGILINNAGAALAGGFVEQEPDEIARIITLNSMAPARLARAVAARFATAGQGAIVNIGSVVG